MPVRRRISSVPEDPAAGRRLLVTRPAPQAAQWVALLRERRVDAEALPLIAIAPVPDAAPLNAEWQALGRRRLLVFVSPNAVERFFAARPEGVAWPAGLVAGAPGPGSLAALLAQGVPAEAVVEPAAAAAQFDSESLWQQLQRRDWRGASVLMVRGDGGRQWLAERLSEAGAQVDFLCAYHRVPAVLDAGGRQLLQRAFEQPQRHAWLFSSSEAIDHLQAASGRGGGVLDGQLRSSCAVTTHPAIGERARRAGFGRVESCRPTPDSVAACLQSLAAAESPTP